MKIRINSILLSMFLIFGSWSMAQDLNVKNIELPASKDAIKKGMYVETVKTDQDLLRTFIAYDLKKGQLGFDVFTLDMDGKLLESASLEANSENEKKYNVTINDPNSVKFPGNGMSVLRLVTANGVLGKLNIEKGKFHAIYKTDKDQSGYTITYTKVLKGFRFKETESNKSEMRLNIFAAHCKEGDDLEKSYTILEGLIPNTIGYFKTDAVIAFLGKDIRVDLKNPKGSNFLVTGQFDGKTNSFINIKEHELEYNVRTVTTGWDGLGNRSYLVSTLNAPTSSKELNKTQAKGRPFMTYLTMDTEGNIVDNVTFDSKSVRGNFGVFGVEKAHYIFGNINSKHDGYYRFDVGKSTDFQLIKIEDGNVVTKKLYSMDELLAKAKTASGKKPKLNYKDITFQWFKKLENGDIMAFAHSAKNYLLYQFGADAELKSLYVYDIMEGIGHSLDMEEIDGLLYVLYRTQAPGMQQGFKKDIHFGGDVDFSRVDELVTFGRLVRIDTNQELCSEAVDFMPDLILGANPMFKGKNGGVILPIRDKKNNYRYSLIR